ncbi:Cbb3-type cytochrome c oxidase subunit OS=Castellaniella defragrans OX=75697 GN=HNR28_000836 PE=3 SV=1 [Castellaniella defragrans]
MSDFVSGFWGWYIAVVALGGIAWCVYLLFSQRAWLRREVRTVENTGHVWDGDLTELNNPVPRWWTVMYLLLCAFALGYLVLYPGLGSFRGALGFTAGGQLLQDQESFNARIQPVYQRFGNMPIPEIARDAQAQEIGQRLFLNNCAQCHGSDAKGGKGFPNLTDRDWLWGGSPEQILQTITEGRHGVMPAWKAAIQPAEALAIAEYVRSLSGLAYDPLHLNAGQRGFQTYCAACHGMDGKGNTAMGAPNLTDDVWLYGSSEATIVETILNGRDNQMPAQKQHLTPEQIRLLTAWVWGQSNR